jgi:hypothetical protein
MMDRIVRSMRLSGLGESPGCGVSRFRPDNGAWSGQFVAGVTLGVAPLCYLWTPDRGQLSLFRLWLVRPNGTGE